MKHNNAASFDLWLLVTDLHAARPWCRGQPACLMACEHGFEKDTFGCNTCRCLAPPPACVRIACALEKPCEYGLEYDANGCRTCDCLPDPCSVGPFIQTDLIQIGVLLRSVSSVIAMLKQTCCAQSVNCCVVSCRV